MLEVEEIARFSLMDLGYFRAEIDEPVEISEMPGNKDRYRISLTARTGRQYRLRELTFTNSKVFPNHQLRALFNIRDGDIFNRTAMTEGLEGMRKLYGAKGYINFTSVPDSIVDEEDGTISVTIDIDSGPIFHISSVKFLGLDPVDANRLIAEIPLRLGTIYDSNLFEQLLLRLQKELPRLRPGRDVEILQDDHAGTVAIKIDARECPLFPY